MSFSSIVNQFSTSSMIGTVFDMGTYSFLELIMDLILEFESINSTLKIPANSFFK